MVAGTIVTVVARYGREIVDVLLNQQYIRELQLAEKAIVILFLTKNHQSVRRERRNHLLGKRHREPEVEYRTGICPEAERRETLRCTRVSPLRMISPREDSARLALLDQRVRLARCSRVRIPC